MANNGPGRPEKKIQSTDTDESQDLEKTLEDATSGVVDAAKTNSTTLVVGVLFLLALISLPSLLGRIEEQKIQRWNDQIDACLAQEKELVLSNYPALLDELEGTPVEAYAYSRVSTWMWNQDDADLRNATLQLLENASTKFPTDMLISTRIMEYSSTIASNATFTLPEPPVVEVIETEAPAEGTVAPAGDTPTPVGGVSVPADETAGGSAATTVNEEPKIDFGDSDPATIPQNPADSGESEPSDSGQSDSGQSEPSDSGR